VAPGFIETRLTQAGHRIPEQVRQMALMLIALQRYGQPEDVANAHLYLASEEADYVSGVILPVAGGQLGE
jgi:NAD(P)-dependent dehydrogenase (short-subunit alcohol dehydrogenase family)